MWACSRIASPKSQAAPSHVIAIMRTPGCPSFLEPVFCLVGRSLAEGVHDRELIVPNPIVIFKALRESRETL